MKISELKMLGVQKGMLHHACYYCCQNSRKKPFEALTCKEIGQVGSKGSGIAEATKMFQKLLESLIELKWKTSGLDSYPHG